MLCPVYVADVESEAPYVEPRKWIPDWWFDANLALECGLISLASVFGIDAMFALLITGEIG